MELSALTIQQLRYLVALDHHRSFREAANACHVSQPALSAQIKKVEGLLGLSVFDRSRQPIVPTERGARIVAQARVALVQVERIGLIVERAEELSGPYRLGVLPTLSPTFLPLFLPVFASTYPKVDLQIREVPTDLLIRLLREGALDGALAVTPLEVPGLNERPLCFETLYAYLPPGHSLAARSHVHQSDLVGERLWLLAEGHCFRTQVLHLCSADRRPDSDADGNVHFEGSSFETIAHLVDAGFGVTVLPELNVRALSSTQRAEQVRSFEGPEPVRQVSFIERREHAREGVGDALFRLMQSQIPAELTETAKKKRNVLSPTKAKAAKK
ncbi:MAG TPA: hydrogen peroxide-inducible genes activator [Polyangiaceae bacterium]